MGWGSWDSFWKDAGDAVRNTGIVAGSALVGAGTGFAVGFAVGGVGSIPGAIIGAIAGAGSGVAIVNQIYEGEKQQAAADQAQTTLNKQQTLLDKNKELLEKEYAQKKTELDQSFEVDDTEQLKAFTALIRGKDYTPPAGGKTKNELLLSLGLTQDNIDNWGGMTADQRESAYNAASGNLGDEGQKAMLEFQVAEIDQRTQQNKMAAATLQATLNNNIFKGQISAAGDQIQARGEEAEAIAGAGQDSEYKSTASLNYVLSKEVESINSLIRQTGQSGYSTSFAQDSADPSSLGATRDLEMFRAARDSMLDTTLPGEINLGNNSQYQNFLLDANAVREKGAAFWAGATNQLDNMGTGRSNNLAGLDLWKEGQNNALEGNQIAIDDKQWQLDQWQTDLKTYDLADFTQDLSSVIQITTGVMDFATGAMAFEGGMSGSNAWKFNDPAKPESGLSFWGAWARARS